MSDYIYKKWWLPEQFIWYVFECLCIAGLLLEHGEMERNPMGSWAPIIHRDMKGANVFLGLPDERNYCRYPVPKLGDFGLAIYLPEGEMFNHETRGTPVNLPIEQAPGLMRLKGKSWPLTSKANVWGIANIVLSLVVKQEGILDFEKGALTEPDFTTDETNQYSEALRNLISDCMRYDPGDRFDLAHVLRVIQNHKASAQGISLQYEPSDSNVWNEHQLDPAILDLVCTLQTL